MDEPNVDQATRGPDAPGSPGGKHALPERVGRFRIVRRLGQGGMGSVYQAEDTELGRSVALKVAHLDASDPEEVVERFKREARAAASLDHPYLCPVHDINVVDGMYYIIMAYVEGRSLAQVIENAGGLPPRQVAALVGKLAVALQEAHQKGVYHRDLKPSNVMIKSTGRGNVPVIVDFGLARRRDGADRLTKTGQVVGTPQYMAPEQIRGSDEDTGSADIFALGVILYELLTGRLPFDGPTHLAIIAQILTQPAAPPSTHRPDLDPALEAICLKAMAKQPSERYATMGELATALTDYLRAAPNDPATPSGELLKVTPGGSPGPAAPRQTGSETLMGQLLNRAGDAPQPAADRRSGSIRARRETGEVPAPASAADPASPEARPEEGPGPRPPSDPALWRRPAVMVAAGGSLIGLVAIVLAAAWFLPGRERASDGFPEPNAPVSAFHGWNPPSAPPSRVANARPNGPGSLSKPPAPPQPASVAAKTSDVVPGPPPPGSWIALFNGRDLTGMQETPQMPKGLDGRSYYEFESYKWLVQQGILSGNGRSRNPLIPHGLYLSPLSLTFKDFRLRAEVMVEDGTWARLVVRNRFRPAGNNNVSWQGIAVWMSGRRGANLLSHSGTVTAFASGVPDRILYPVGGQYTKPGQWFTLEVTARGHEIVVAIDGRNVADCNDSKGVFDEPGRITALVEGSVRFRSIRVMSLDGTTAPATTEPRGDYLAGVGLAAAADRAGETPATEPVSARSPTAAPSSGRLARGGALPSPSRKGGAAPAAGEAESMLPPIAPGDPPALVDEDFQKVDEGRLPAGWASNGANLAVRPTSRGPAYRLSGQRSTPSGPPALALIDSSRPDYVTLPDLGQELAGDFAVDCAFTIPRSDVGIGIGLQGRSTEVLTVEVFGDGILRVQGRHPGKARPLRTGGANHLRIERRGNDYSVALNGIDLGALPVNLGKVRFRVVSLQLGERLTPRRIGTTGKRAPTPTVSRAPSPVIHRIRVVPLGPS